jgi:hypothetical protein
VTADVDPLDCLNSRVAGGEPECHELDSAHCEGCALCPGFCTCHKPTPLDEAMLAAALDAFARHGGAVSWRALDDVISHHTAESYRGDVTAAIAPLQAEIRRLTASPDPAMLPSARELVDAWNRRTDDEQLALAAQFLERQEHALRCALGRCTTKENDRG